MTVLGTGHLGKRRDHRKLLQLHVTHALPVRSWIDDPLGRVPVGLPLPAGGLEVRVEQSLRQRLVGELVDPPARAPVAILEQSRVDTVEPRTRDDAQPSRYGNRPRQPVIGHVYAHPALNDCGQLRLTSECLSHLLPRRQPGRSIAGSARRTDQFLGARSIIAVVVRRSTVRFTHQPP